MAEPKGRQRVNGSRIALLQANDFYAKYSCRLLGYRSTGSERRKAALAEFSANIERE